ncbi:integrase core domain-containing protein [Micromonospora sp. 4G57]|uniref:Integrase core domain-containing protein n=1 Tax=Micromonospora sicca TaxID=2202420 RepID=A0ABU5JM17_9ACTN|nr:MULTISPECIES: integrase core domain-containing protein [unclassified Micromonospora]MDZ5446988.1 integrase core domain-containing protein [Micromonospora sp. 4G57]MDZ5493665.1 integrase core domain-containing protein [Micromonospora sp. 4G53]
MYVFAVIEHANRRIRILGATAHPTASCVAQAAKNLVMDLEDAGCRARFLIRDRDGKFSELFDAVLKDAAIEVVLSGVRMPRMNSIMERWVQTCRRELLDRTLIWNQHHLLHALREFEEFYNCHRPHQGIANARPLPPLAGADRRSGQDGLPQHTKTRAPRRHPPRVRACRVTCADEVFGKGSITTYCGVPSNSVLTPRRISNEVGGQAAKKPMISPTWIMSQNTGLPGRRVSWKTRKCISASQPNRPSSKTDTVSRSLLKISRSLLKNFRIAAHALRPPV